MTDIDTSELKRFAADCKAAVPGLEKEFYASLAAAGEIVAARARSKAPSSRIAGTIHTRRRGVRVRIEAGGDAAPHAAPLENHGVPGSFRHPVFGNYDNWVSQPARPFLTPAAEESVGEVEAAVLRAVDITTARLV